jgi:ribosomal protein S18 acetylase RimI-like enzyme
VTGPDADDDSPASLAQIRPIRPQDYQAVMSVIDDWWNGRQMADKLPRLFFEHFTDTSFAAERHGELAGFLVGFISQSRPGEAYIHFVGVHPDERGRGLGRRLYEHFFAAVRARGCELVRAITAPVNQGSIGFHRQMGFGIEPGDSEINGVPVTSGYDGSGHDRVRFVKNLAAS